MGQMIGLERPDSGRIVIDGVDLLALGEVALLLFTMRAPADA
jgi:hypothetical protein